MHVPDRDFLFVSSGDKRLAVRRQGQGWPLSFVTLELMQQLSRGNFPEPNNFIPIRGRQHLTVARPCQAADETGLRRERRLLPGFHIPQPHPIHPSASQQLAARRPCRTHVSWAVRSKGAEKLTGG